MTENSETNQHETNLSGRQLRISSGPVPGVGSMGVSTTGTAPAEMDTLRKIAEAATPGPWSLEYENSDDWEAGINDGDYPHTIHGPRNVSFDSWQDQSKVQDSLNRITEITEMTDADAIHIATFDPPTVLALLTRVGQAKAQKMLEEKVSELIGRERRAVAQVARVRALRNSWADASHDPYAGLSPANAARAIDHALGGEPNE